jgi:2,4-dienoyl-CoA reductase-like NADH-dependent reductase (Old Yellow Enzyme family)
MGTTTVHLLREVEKFLKNSNVPAARFGREAMGDPRFVFDLRRGREPRPRTIERVRLYLETIQ